MKIALLEISLFLQLALFSSAQKIVNYKDKIEIKN